MRGARQHNLKGFDLEIPRRAFTVITGPSGSGKSSLAFDTIYAEGQRRYVESLSAYARQFLERMEKPDVDSIDGLSPAVAIEQKNPTKTSRSTVGTATEIYDYLRLLWARVGHTFCPLCGREMQPDTVQSVTDTVLALPARYALLRRVPARAVAGGHPRGRGRESSRAGIRARQRRRRHHASRRAARPKRSTSTFAKELLVVVDRLVGRRRRAGPASPTPSAPRSAKATAMHCHPERSRSDLLSANRRRAPLHRALRVPERRHPRAPPTPQLFSFNNPRGACTQCNGFGAVLEYDEALIVPYPERSLRDGAIDPWTKPRYDNKRRALAEFAKREGIPMDVPWEKLPRRAARASCSARKSRGYKGIFPFLEDLEEKRYKQYIRVFLRQYQTAQECPTATARSSSPKRCRCASPAATSPR